MENLILPFKKLDDLITPSLTTTKQVECEFCGLEFVSADFNPYVPREKQTEKKIFNLMGLSVVNLCCERKIIKVMTEIFPLLLKKLNPLITERAINLKSRQADQELFEAISQTYPSLSSLLEEYKKTEIGVRCRICIQTYCPFNAKDESLFTYVFVNKTEIAENCCGHKFLKIIACLFPIICQKANYLAQKKIKELQSFTAQTQ